MRVKQSSRMKIRCNVKVVCIERQVYMEDRCQKVVVTVVNLTVEVLVIWVNEVVNTTITIIITNLDSASLVSSTIEEVDVDVAIEEIEVVVAIEEIVVDVVIEEIVVDVVIV